jgi:hypothetical protein
MELPTIIKLGLTQTEFFIREKVTKYRHKYFSSEACDFRNLTKLVWHFSHFSVNLYGFLKFQLKMRKWKTFKGG